MPDRVLRLSIGRTIQPQQYESMKVEIAIEEKIPDGMDPDTWFDRMKGFIAIKLEEYGVALPMPDKYDETTELDKLEDEVIKRIPEKKVDKSTYLRWQNNRYEIKATIEAETDKAYQLKLFGTMNLLWVPKSQTTVLGEGWFSVPTWKLKAEKIVEADK